MSPAPGGALPVGPGWSRLDPGPRAAAAPARTTFPIAPREPSDYNSHGSSLGGVAPPRPVTFRRYGDVVTSRGERSGRRRRRGPARSRFRPGHGGPAAPRRPAARGAAAPAGRGGPARQAHGPVRPPALPAGPAGPCGLGAPSSAQPGLPEPRQQTQGVLGAPHHRVLHAGDVRRGGQRGGLQELRALVQEVRGGVAALGSHQGAAGGGVPARAGALHVHRHPGAATPRQGRVHRRAPLQPPGNQLALQPRHPRLPPHQHRGFLDLLRVPLPAALPAGHRLLRRGGEADGGGLRAPRRQDLRARDAHPAGAHVPRGAPDVRGGPGGALPGPLVPHPTKSLIFIQVRFRCCCLNAPSTPGGRREPPQELPRFCS